MALTEPLPDSGITYNRDLRELVLDGEVDFDSDRPLYTYCLEHPDVHRPSVAVYEDHAYCYTCRTWFSKRGFSKRFTSMEMTAAKLRAGTARRVAKAPVDANLLTDVAHSVLMAEKSKLAYLEQRGIDLLTVELYRLGHNGMAYTLPVWDLPTYDDGEVVNVRFRRDDIEMPDGRSKYWGLRGHNASLWYPFPPESGDDIILTEGEFDALLLRRYLLPAFSLTDGAKAGFDLVAAKKPARVILCRDQDTAGVEGTEALIEVLSEESPETVTKPVTWRNHKDVTEVWQKDPGCFQRIVEGLQEMIRNADGF